MLLAAVALASGGFWLGRRSVTPVPTAAAPANPSVSVAPPPPESSAGSVCSPAGESPSRESSRRDDLAALARRDPAAALARALAEPNRGRRERFLKTALRAWAENAPADAAHWALARPAGEREAALASVIAGAAAQPDEAVFLVRQLCDAEPALALERGSALIAALGERESFAEAAKFAAAGAPAQRDAWTGAAYARWAENEPKAAADSALALADPAQRDAALRAAITGWAPNEPASLADFAVKLPAGETRLYALGESMRQWIDADPVAAAAWIDRFEPSAELDNAVAAIAQQPYLAERRPDVALSWAESITDRGVRAATLGQLVQAWAQRDPAAARRYIETSRDLRAEDRTDLLNVLGR